MFYVYITTGVQQTSRFFLQNNTQNTSMRTCSFYFDFKLYPNKKCFLLRSTLSKRLHPVATCHHCCDGENQAAAYIYLIGLISEGLYANASPSNIELFSNRIYNFSIFLSQCELSPIGVSVYIQTLHNRHSSFFQKLIHLRGKKLGAGGGFNHHGLCNRPDGILLKLRGGKQVGVLKESFRVHGWVGAAPILLPKN